MPKKNDTATLDLCPVNLSAVQNKCCFVCSPWRKLCTRFQLGNWSIWRMLTLVWKSRRIPLPIPPPALRWGPCASMRYCLWPLCPPFFLSIHFPAPCERLDLQCLSRKDGLSSSCIICYLRLGLSPGPFLALREGLLCWDSGLCHAVLWLAGEQL